MRFRGGIACPIVGLSESGYVGNTFQIQMGFKNRSNKKDPQTLTIIISGGHPSNNMGRRSFENVRGAMTCATTNFYLLH